MRNTAIAMLALVMLVGLRESGAGGQGILQAMQQAVESEWDENVGRLSFVNGKIGETVAVFNQGFSSDPSLVAPVCATPTQAENCLLYQEAGTVYVAAAGEVTQIANDDRDQTIVHIYHDNGLHTLYYGLNNCFVQEGEAVNTHTELGEAGSAFAFEARRNSKAVDCLRFMTERDEKP